MCFARVSPSIAPVPTTTVWLVSPHDQPHLNLTTTAITGQALSGQDALYSAVTISYTSNAGKVVGAAATGAASGFGVAGPAGAAVGFVLGAAGGLPGAPAGAPPLDGALRPFICDDPVDDVIDLSSPDATSQLPYIVFPITLHSEDAKPFVAQAHQTFGPTSPDQCWHLLPNTAHVSDVVPQPAAASTTTPKGLRQAVSGDGWLYRIALENDGDAASAGALDSTKYFKTLEGRDDFPIPFCRKVKVQITWWAALRDAIASAPAGQAPNPLAISFETTVSDPSYVVDAVVKKGAAITFKQDCGATVSLTPDTSQAATISAFVSAAQTIYNAEQTWQKNQPKK